MVHGAGGWHTRGIVLGSLLVRPSGRSVHFRSVVLAAQALQLGRAAADVDVRLEAEVFLEDQKQSVPLEAGVLHEGQADVLAARAV